MADVPSLVNITVSMQLFNLFTNTLLAKSMDPLIFVRSTKSMFELIKHAERDFKIEVGLHTPGG